jgi:purine-binding chemotaxis protein CheW
MENINNKIHTYLGFRIGIEFFAIDAKNVIEVLRKQEVASIPKTADYINGIIHFRGDILTVVSASKKLNVPVGENSQKQVIIVLEFESGTRMSKLGIIADKVIGVININENEIKPVMEFGNYYNPEFLKGAFKYKNNIITILHVDKIFTENEVEIIIASKEKIN